jgi:RecA/RadA recombinase
MAPKKKMTPTPTTRAAALVDRLTKNSKKERDIYCASDIMKGWRYVDFRNPQYGIPCLALEYLFGCRGLLAGRIIKLQASYGVGKSSFMWLMYAAAQQPGCDAFCYHIETEGAPPPPDFIASFGCDPSNLATGQPKSLEQCFELLDETMAEIRGGLGGGINPETGRKQKSKYTDPLDPDCEVPIVIGIDSFSALGLETEVEEDILDMRKTSALAEHSRKLSKYMRDRTDRFKKGQALLMLAAQQKSKINTGMSRGAGSDKTTLADSVIGFHATYALEMQSYPYKDKAGNDIGDRIIVKTTKNKLSPKNRVIDLYLVRNHGFDLAKTDFEFITKHSDSPLKEVTYKHSHGVTCKPLSDKSFPDEGSFLKALYANEELIKGVRQALRIRGFGFDFETKYVPSASELEDNEQSAESDIGDGVEGSTEEVQAAGDADGSKS